MLEATRAELTKTTIERSESESRAEADRRELTRMIISQSQSAERVRTLEAELQEIQEQARKAEAQVREAATHLRVISHLAQCVIYFNTLKKPITLMCRHSFCQDCLDLWVGKGGQQAEEEDRRFVVICPTCRTPIRGYIQVCALEDLSNYIAVLQPSIP